MRVAIVLPTKGRAAQMRRNVNTLLSIPLPDKVTDFTLLLGVIWTDKDTVLAAQELQKEWRENGREIIIVNREPESTTVQGFNQCYAAFWDKADWFVLGSDDQVYHAGWLDNALKLAEKTGAHVVGLNDLRTNIDEYAPHFAMSGEFIQAELGGFMVPPEYKTWWFDREICERAQRLGVYAACWQSVVEHCHPDWGTAKIDDTYREMTPYRDADKNLYLSRRKINYADAEVC